jgi:hypothetical protein
MAKMFYVSLVDKYQILVVFLPWYTNLILSFMQEYFCLVDGVSEVESSTVLDNATWKVIKDAFKHT